MASFTFNGTTVVEPSILVRTIIGAQVALSLLPFGTLLFVGASDGGVGQGTAYRFTDLNSAKAVLRSGALLNAMQLAANVGGAAGFVAVVAGTKTPATLALKSGAASLSSGDQGTWTNGITVTSVAGTTSGNAVTFTYPSSSGNTVTIGGPNTAYDNLASFSALRAVMLADGLVTPPSSSQRPPLLTLTITTDGAIGLISTTSLAGGTGNGSATLAFADVKTALDAIDDVAFDIGHLVGVYDAPSQAYANGKAKAHEVYGYLQRWVHQVQVSGASAANTKAQNSAAVANTAIGAATAMNYYRATVCAQRFLNYTPATGQYAYVDAAPLFCGLAAYVGATDQWGPASPLTHVFVPTAADVDYPVLRTTGDQGRAILGGVTLFETIGGAAAGNVRCVQSVTTQPIDPSTGLNWILGEFSGVRAGDAVLANVKAEIETNKPRAIGGGNTTGTLNSLIGLVVNVLELALDAQWLTGYDKKSITIATTGSTGSDDLITYSASVTPPLNHIGISQTLLPFAATLSA